MTRRYLFALPDMTRPVGGVNVQYQIMQVLHNAGWRVAALHARGRYRYPFTTADVEVLSLPALEGALSGGLLAQVRKAGLRRFWNDRIALRAVSTGVNPLVRPGLGDVVVLPEFAYARWAPLFPGVPMVLAAQDAFGLARAFTRDTVTPSLHRRFYSVYSTSQVSGAAVQTLLGREPHQIGLAIDATGLDPLPKAVQIAYMPRKRAEEGALVLAALRTRMGADMPPVVAIAGMTDEQRNRVLRESLFFLSFSQMEGFGLPPAEAMAAGCIVVGYTGVGGNEYFTPATGFPVEDSDIVGFVATVERLVHNWRLDPAPLDALRLAARDRIRAAYDPEAWRTRLLAAWEKIDRDIDGGPGGG